MISFNSFLAIIEIAADVRTRYAYMEKGLKKQGDFTELTYDNFYGYCKYLGLTVDRPKTPEDILKIAETLGF